MNTDNSNPGPVNLAPTGSTTASADCLQRVVSRERTTQIIREECERRLATVKNGVECAIFAIEHANPQLADQYLDDVVRYGQLAKLDAKELQRRLHG